MSAFYKKDIFTKTNVIIFKHNICNSSHLNDVSNSYWVKKITCYKFYFHGYDNFLKLFAISFKYSIALIIITLPYQVYFDSCVMSNIAASKLSMIFFIYIYYYPINIFLIIFTENSQFLFLSLTQISIFWAKFLSTWTHVLNRRFQFDPKSPFHHALGLAVLILFLFIFLAEITFQRLSICTQRLAICEPVSSPRCVGST